MSSPALASVESLDYPPSLASTGTASCVRSIYARKWSGFPEISAMDEVEPPEASRGLTLQIDFSDSRCRAISALTVHQALFLFPSLPPSLLPASLPLSSLLLFLPPSPPPLSLSRRRSQKVEGEGEFDAVQRRMGVWMKERHGDRGRNEEKGSETESERGREKIGISTETA